MLIITCSAGSCGVDAGKREAQHARFGVRPRGRLEALAVPLDLGGTPSASTVKKRVRRSYGCRLRSAMSSRVKRSIARAAGANDQSSQLMSLSWQYALLLPRCVRSTSSPAVQHRHALAQQQHAP